MVLCHWPLFLWPLPGTQTVMSRGASGIQKPWDEHHQERWSGRQTKPETQTPGWSYSNYFWTLWSVLDWQFLNFLICVKNRLLCSKPHFCVCSVTGAESNSYSTQVPGFTVSIYSRPIYVCVSVSEASTDWNNFSHDSSNTPNFSGNLDKYVPISKQARLVYSPSWLF